MLASPSPAFTDGLRRLLQVIIGPRGEDWRTLVVFGMLSFSARLLLASSVLVACRSPTPERIAACVKEQRANRTSAYGRTLQGLVARTRKNCIPPDGEEVAHVKEVFPIPLVMHPPTGKLVEFVYFPVQWSSADSGWVTTQFRGVSFDECCEIRGVAAPLGDWDPWDGYRGCVPFELLEDNGLLTSASDHACASRERGRPTSAGDAGRTRSEPRLPK